MAILKDILYEEEKERIASKYRMSILRIGEATCHFKPKQKAILLEAMKLSGFTKDDLRERGWTFSTHLWNSASQVEIHLPPVMGSKRSKKVQHVLTETTFSSRRRQRLA